MPYFCSYQIIEVNLFIKLLGIHISAGKQLNMIPVKLNEVYICILVHVLRYGNEVAGC